MTMEIIGSVDKDRLYCSGSFSKFLTTYVCLSFLSEKYELSNIIDDVDFLDRIAVNASTKDFLNTFQKIIQSKFTIHDLCTYYTGLPYTFSLTQQELTTVENGHPFKHHSIMDEKIFLSMCKENITAVYTNQCKFHYSEISILFLGYLVEKIYDVKMEDLYQKYVIDKFQLKDSIFSRVRPKNVYCQDLSDEYDYPAIAILDHGYFCYSNGFFTTLNDTKILLEQIFHEPVFQFMVDIKNARAASPRLMNGLAVEIRIAGDDILYGYEGLSYSGCNAWSYSTKNKKGYITFTNNEDEAYDMLYQPYGYAEFDPVPVETTLIYKNFIKQYDYLKSSPNIPEEYQGNYQRVNINEKKLETIFLVENDYIVIRNPDTIKYNVIYVNGHYRIKNKDNTHGTTVAFYTAKSGHLYFLFDGTLYKKCN